MKAENSVKIQFDSLSANEAFARGAAAAFLALSLIHISEPTRRS